MSAEQESLTPGLSSTRVLGVVGIVRLLLIVLLVGGSGYLFLSHDELFRNPQLVKSEILSWGVWGPLGYILLYAFGPSLLLPGAVMTVAAGLAFGLVRGAIYAVVGAELGALVAFWAGRFLGHNLTQRLIVNRFTELCDRISRNGFAIILYLRIFPVVPYNALNLVAGASPIRFRDYFWASLIGLVPGTALFAFLGNELWHPTSPRFILAVLLIVLCFIGGEIYRRKVLGRREAAGA